MINLNNPKFAATVAHFTRACRASRLHSSEAQRAFANYGDHGVQISGCVREHFPERIKDRLRFLARLVTTELEKASAARPARVRAATIHKLGRLVATRDGSGFYGPQPYRENRP